MMAAKAAPMVTLPAEAKPRRTIRLLGVGLWTGVQGPGRDSLCPLHVTGIPTALGSAFQVRQRGNLKQQILISLCF